MGRFRSAAATVAWVLALAALSAGLLAQGGRFSLVLDALTHPAPLYLLASLLALALAVVVRPRSWRLLAAAAVLGAANAALFVAPELFARPAAPAAEGRELKIVVFNVWSDNPQAEKAAQWLLDQDADVIVLEEGRLVRSRLMARGYAPACYGCSPVIFARTTPERRFPPPRVWDEASGVTWAEYSHERLGDFAVVAVHGAWPNRLARLEAQRRAIRSHLSHLPRERLILAGDFNSAPWSFHRRREEADWGLTRRTRGVFTWPAAQASHYPLPAPFPWLPIDHLYAGPGWVTIDVERGPQLGSDHYPIVVRLGEAPVPRGR